MEEGHNPGLPTVPPGSPAETTLIATNYHLLHDDPQAPLDTLIRNREGAEDAVEGTNILWWDRSIDFVIAVTDLPRSEAVSQGMTSRNSLPAIGEDVYAVGNPLGLELIVSRGIVSGLQEVNGIPMIIHDAHINPGNSGGALVDARGRLPGMAGPEE